MPQDVTDVERAFPADIGRLMPTQEEIDQIPDDYLKEAQDFISTWFCNGLNVETRWMPAPGVELGKALRHLDVCLGSFEPKHEDKLLGCAALASRFFENVKYAPGKGEKTKWVGFEGYLYESAAG